MCCGDKVIKNSVQMSVLVVRDGKRWYMGLGKFQWIHIGK